MKRLQGGHEASFVPSFGKILCKGALFKTRLSFPNFPRFLGGSRRGSFPQRSSIVFGNKQLPGMTSLQFERLECSDIRLQHITL